MWSNDNASRAAGMELVEVGTGRAVLRLVVGPAHVNGLGVCHGGYLFMLAESAMAFASNSENHVALAAAAQIDFLRPAFLGDTLEAIATMRSSGKRTGITDVEVRTVASGDRASGDHATLIALLRGRTTRTGAHVVGGEEPSR
jgi:acyl-CoA thioesterase